MNKYLLSTLLFLLGPPSEAKLIQDIGKANSDIASILLEINKDVIRDFAIFDIEPSETKSFQSGARSALFLAMDAIKNKNGKMALDALSDYARLKRANLFLSVLNGVKNSSLTNEYDARGKKMELYLNELRNRFESALLLNEMILKKSYNKKKNIL